MPDYNCLQDQKHYEPSAARAGRTGSPALTRQFAALNASPRSMHLAAQAAALQRKANRTGLPDDLKSNAEALSGLSLDDVRVHYNSHQPAQFQALATAQGRDIHLAPGQERHLPHETWHVVQQMQGRVPVTAQMFGMPMNASPTLEAEAERMGAAALQPRARTPLQGYRTALLNNTALSPVQCMPGWDTMKSVLTGAAIGGGLAFAGFGWPVAATLALMSGVATKAGGVGAGIGAAALGLGAGWAGGLIPGAAGTAAKIGLGAVGGLFGGTSGADLQSKITSKISPYHVEHTANRIPDISDIVCRRAYELARKKVLAGTDVTLGDVVRKIDDAKLKKAVYGNATVRAGYNKRVSGDRKDKEAYDRLNYLSYLTDIYYRNSSRIAEPKRRAVAAENEVKSYNRRIIRVLQNDPFIQSVQSEGIFRTVAPANPAVDLAPGAGMIPNEARRKFNRLVERAPALPQVTVRGNGLDPSSAMSHDNTMFHGWGSPKDTLVHEFGHHLENNLLPGEFGTLHNFLRARSMSGMYRKVGGEHVLINKEPTGEGYDTATPNPVVGGNTSLTRLGVNFLRWKLGSSDAEMNIERTTQTTSHVPESSYTTKVYKPDPGHEFDLDDNGFSTEFLSTTAQLMARGETAKELVKRDPLRVCLFLYIAKRSVYDTIKGKLAVQHINLDDLIHRLG